MSSLHPGCNECRGTYGKAAEVAGGLLIHQRYEVLKILGDPWGKVM